MNIEQSFFDETGNCPRVVLLVDDSPVNLGVVVESLETHGLEVLVALDGQEALRRAESIVPDLILLDVMMPGMDGFEVCRRLKAQAATRDIPVIFMTSLDGTKDKVAGFELGAVDYITKPLQIDEVRARITTHLKLRALQQQLEQKNTLLLQEIVERQQVMDALQRSQASLAEAQHIGQMGNWELDLVNGGLTWSAEVFNIFEIDPAQFGASYEAFLAAVHPEDRDALDAAYTQSFEERVPYDFVHRLLMPDGRIKHVREHCENYFAADGTPLRSHGTVQDISAQRRAEESLRQREREFRTLAENSPDIVVRYDRDCRFVYANPAFQKRLCHTLDELRGKRPTELPGLLEANFIEQRLMEVLQTGVADEFERHIHSVEGAPFWGLVHIVPEFDEAGKVAFAQVLTRDISALKENEHALAKSREQLRELALHRDSEQEEERKRLAWEVHEGVGQYLMALRMNLNVFDDTHGKENPLLHEHARKMLAMVDEGIRLVREVTVALRPRVLDLGLSVSLEWLAGEFAEHYGIACEIDQPQEEIPLNERATTALYRVAEEALALLARHGSAERVDVVLEEASTFVRLTVREQTQTPGETLRTDGEDFGLAWTQELIVAMGGEFVILVSPGQGVTVEATVPMQAGM